MGRNKKAIEPDLLFEATSMMSPFLDEATSPYLLALLDLPPNQRKAIVRQVVLLCGAIEGITPFDALEILAKLGMFLNKNSR